MLLVNDGMHRVYAARSLGLPVTVVLARGVPPTTPTTPTPWTEAGPRSAGGAPGRPPEERYRQPNNYKSLSATSMPSSQAFRRNERQSNPSHIVMEAWRLVFGQRLRRPMHFVTEDFLANLQPGMIASAAA